MVVQTDKFDVMITSPSAIIWKGIATSVSSKNSVGPFDILAAHENFVTMVENEPIIVRSGDKEKSFQYENAVISVYDKKVIVYANI